LEIKRPALEVEVKKKKPESRRAGKKNRVGK
jgi:hypothetical protein